MADNAPSVEKSWVPDWIQQIIGPLVVATVIGLVGDRYRLGNTLDDLAGAQLTHQIYIDELNAFRTKGERFTYEDGETLKSDMTDLVGDCKAAATKIQAIELDIAKLPPSRWQERILRLENQIHELRALIRLGNGFSKESEWNFRGIEKPKDAFRAVDDLGIKPMDITGNDRLPVRH